MNSPTKPGRPANPNLRKQREEEILRAAAILFAEKGYAPTDLQELAQRLGVGKGTVYRYFPTKQDLFLATVKHEITRFTTTLESMVPRDAPLIEQMSLVIEAYLQFFQQNPDVVELMVIERSHFKHRRPTYFDLENDPSCARWDALVSALIEQGVLRSMPLDKVRRVVGDLIYGTMFSNYMAGRVASPQEQAREIMDVLYGGLLTAEGWEVWRAHMNTGRSSGRQDEIEQPVNSTAAPTRS
ncbi:Fatty acid metabolism regulator protein [Planctopirus ephydatiae]|uniref:Fatty acid metabolism regulator protein n=1 Tax=Planctopirus ephydatiae TaxID=2528019 RepID=A0A518GLL3_9PLAN|nr:TetR/AcrR family transcriptional regulator [Planctopirus ephydatiae]QDV29436.1 Fatty acid metabolism regulator protein [Planctopirus ephydatiae]